MNADGFAELAYGSESAPLVGDFTENRLIQALIASYDLPENLRLQTTLTLSSGLGDATAASVQASSNLSTRQGVSIFDLDMPEFAAIDFTDIDALTFRFDAPFAGDFNINTIIDDDTPLVIPEPGAARLLLGGTLGLAFRRRRA